MWKRNGLDVLYARLSLSATDSIFTSAARSAAVYTDAESMPETVIPLWSIMTVIVA